MQTVIFEKLRVLGEVWDMKKTLDILDYGMVH